MTVTGEGGEAVELQFRNHYGAVVKDIDKTTKLWSAMLAPLGIGPWNIVEISATKDQLLAGNPFRMKIAVAQLEAVGSLQLELLQPLEGDSVWSQFYKKHGEGWHHVDLGVPGHYDEVVSSFQEHGGKVLFHIIKPAPGVNRGCYIEASPGGPHFGFMDLATRGINR